MLYVLQVVYYKCFPKDREKILLEDDYVIYSPPIMNKVS